MHRVPAARRLVQAAELLCRGSLQCGRATAPASEQSQFAAFLARGPAITDAWRWRGFAEQPSGDGAAPGSDSAEADGGSTPAAASAASQPPAASAPASPSSAQANSGGAVAEDSEASAPPSLEAAAAEDSADLADADAAGDDEDAAGSDEEGDEDGEWDIELTPTGLQYATTRWDGSRNMTPNRRPTREEREGYIDNEELQEELDHVAVPIPGDVGMYDIQTTLPGLVSPTSAGLDALAEFGPGGIQALLEEVRLLAANMERFEELEDEVPPPRPGAQPILEWEINMVMDTSGSWDHPANRKAVCRVYLRDLQREMGLSDDALQHVALVCGPRYNPETGMLKLVCERYAERDENRAHILEQLYALVAEGHRVHPPQQAAAALT